MRFLLLYCFCFICSYCVAQESFHLLNPKKNNFKFELSGNVVIIPVLVNGEKLSFLLDTGVKETLLFGSAADSLKLENVHKVTFSGIGIEDGIEGLLAVGNSLVVGDVIADFNHNIYVLNGEDLDISSHIGLPIHGILGSKLFESFTVKIDYLKSKITLLPKSILSASQTKNYLKIPITIEKSRPYTQVHINFDSKRSAYAKVLIDLGNSDGMLIFPFTLDNFHIRDPKIYDFIGRGFNGAIFGYRNRIASFTFGDYSIIQPIVAYPDSNAVHAARLAENRKGSIGNQVLQRFHVIFDYENQALYIKPNRKFGKPFPMNMSGIDIKHDGLTWTQKRVSAALSKRNDQDGGINVYQHEEFKYEFSLKPNYVINNVREGSPAALAGIQKEDILHKVNGRYTSDMKLQEIIGKLQELDGQEVKLLIKRNGKEINFRFLLKDPIPYIN
ncbi:PDZ domain-containing protein [Sphingobacterium sp. HJSM2_6]|uniref:PDZ domain-containing protein n=1 Tax=Sphingobacterium sp. HJSM2_6 TaxID=3366264 RepID=UPI003BE35469